VVVDGAVDGALDGVVSVPVEGVVPEPEPVPRGPCPAPSGQSAFVPVPALGAGAVVVPSSEGVVVDGVVVVVPSVALGVDDADGSGLAARTTAVPPTTIRPSASTPVAIVRRMPLVGVDAGATGGDSFVGWIGSMVDLQVVEEEWSRLRRQLQVHRAT